MWVVMFHYWPKLATDVTPALVQKGYLGVELFFVLSGFILCHVYLSAAGEGRLNYGGFLWARLARVYPLHLATLIGVGAMALAAGAAGLAVDGSVLAWSSLPANLLLLHAWGLAPEAGWNHPSWSISAEWFAYLCFPAFAWAAWRLRARPWAACALTAGLMIGLYAVFEAAAGFSLTQATIHWGALRIAPCFALGCAAHLLWRSGVLRGAGAALWGAGASILAAGGMAVLGAPDGLIVLSFGALILCLASVSRAGPTALDAPVLVYLGEISYALYMVCVPWKLLFVNGAARVLDLPGEQLPLFVWLVFVAGAVVLAAAAHHLVERPARRILRDWGRAWFDKPSAAASEAGLSPKQA